MATRVIAWAVAIGLGWGAWQAYSSWQNPWGAAMSASAVVPITAVLPKLPPGCAAKDCAP